MTAPVTDLRTAVADLPQVQALFVTHDRADGWRHRLIQRRRKLQEHIAAVARAWHGIERDIGATETSQRFRIGLLQLRARVAEHQAGWPAVAIDDDDRLFVTSRDAMRAATTEFQAAAAALLDALNRLADKDPPR